MTDSLLYPEEIDRRLNWPLGTAARLARRKRLPHYVLPDGSIRVRWGEIEALVLRVPLPEQQGRIEQGRRSPSLRTVDKIDKAQAAPAGRPKSPAQR